MASINKIKNKMGSIRWVVDYRDINRVRKQKTFQTPKTAKEFKLAIEYKIARIKAGFEEELKPNLKFDDMVDEYFVLIEKQKKPKTIQREKSVVRALRGFIPNHRIRDISSSIYRQYVNYRLEECNIKPATINAEIRTLKAFYNILLAHEYVTVNPMLSVKILPVEHKEPRSLSDDEVARFLSVIRDDNYKDLAQMYLHTGARRSEIISPEFTWNNVNFEERKITLVGKFSQSRVVPLDKKAYDILYRRKFIMNLSVPFDFNYDYLYKRLKKYFNEAGIPDGTTHALRRTFGSKLVQSGVDIYIVSKLLGHSSIKVTEVHYIHLLDDNLKNGVSTLDNQW